MRGLPKQQTMLLSMRTPGKRVRADHPLRRLKDIADAALAALSATLDGMHSGTGQRASHQRNC